MKIIEEPVFLQDNKLGFDALLDREMEMLEGGFNVAFFSDVTTTTDSGQTTTTTTTPEC